MAKGKRRKDKPQKPKKRPGETGKQFKARKREWKQEQRIIKDLKKRGIDPDADYLARKRGEEPPPRPRHERPIPRPKSPSKYWVLCCRSDCPKPPAPACMQAGAGHPGNGRQEGITVLWMDGHTEWLTDNDCDWGSLYGRVAIGATPASDAYMIPKGWGTTW